MQRLVISNHFEEETILEKHFGLIPLPTRVRHLSLSIQHPDGTEEILRFATQNSHKSAGNQDMFVNLNKSKHKVTRANRVQEIVNRLETDGYSVSTSQLALFMDVKIDRLIMEKR